MKAILLQCKFLLVEFLNVSYLLIPNPLRNWYLRLFGIRIGGGKSCIHRGCKFFHVGKMSVGQNTVINFGCYLDNRRGIYIGNNVGIAHNTKIYTLGHDLNDPKFSTKGASVHIGDDVFIFSNALVMPAGQYTFMDYVKVGLPLQIIMGIVMIFVLPLIFPF